MIRVVPAALHHLVGIDYGDKDAQRSILQMVEQQHDAGSWMLTHVARTIIETDFPTDISDPILPAEPRILACFGFWPMWPGCVRAWTMLTTEVLERRPKTLHRVIRGELEDFIQKLTLRRVEAVVDHDHEAGHRWIQRLGFEWEGLMRNYGINAEPCDLYARCQ